MLATKLIAATVAGAAFGAGTLALAPALASGGSSSTTASTDRARHPGPAHVRNVIHADWTTRNRVHHEAIRGIVRSVSAHSVTVRASDGVTETYVVTSATKVRVVGDGSTGQDPIGDVKVGDQALVVGKGARQATHVVARAPKASTGTTQG